MVGTVLSSQLPLTGSNPLVYRLKDNGTLSHFLLPRGLRLMPIDTTCLKFDRISQGRFVPASQRVMLNSIED
ncbi:hypothetical protein DXH47_08230 [Levilactobacillus suantsaii]|uniref:Uncharacterized protein n=1 Tax=Levilactobacillus suantsaii TaxID=2292255 RepID=A0A4Q0VIF3_9LACO|nr:hypothetical protein DXH47_08230 [Levilactobacillus suantsaii]